MNANSTWVATYRDTYNVNRKVRVDAPSRDDALDLLAAWKGGANIAFVSVKEAAEFPNGEFPPQGNVA